jgi:MATE family multidrug resistance protein
MMSHEANNTEYAEGSTREVAHVAWPIVISMLSYTAMGVADTLFVGWVGKTELAAVGIATMAIFLFNSFFMGTLHGVKVISAQATGSGDSAQAVRSGWLGAALALPFGGLVLVATLFAGPLFSALGGPAEVQALGREYFGIRALGAGLWYVTIAMSDYYQGIGDTRTPMRVNLLANAINIAVDPLLIFGIGPIPAMGVGGAALATVIAQGLGMAYIFVLFVRKVGVPRGLRWSEVGELLRLGLPMGVHAALGTGAFTVFTAMIARMGEAELAAHQIAIKIISISFLPGYGLSETATILVGQYVGAGKVPTARRALRSAMGLAVGLMGVCGVVFFLFPEPLITLFNTDEDVVRVGTNLLFVAAFFQVFDAVAMVANGALNGTGDTRFTMFAGVICSWFVLVPAAYVFAYVLGWGAAGAWMGITLEILVLAVVLLVRFYGTAWEK